MKTYIIIPARYQSTRFPGKPLAMIAGKPMIQWVYEAAIKTEGISGTYVATDDSRIFDAVKRFGGIPIMTSETHTCGTDRIRECAEDLGIEGDDIIINLQGDEPLIKSETLGNLSKAFTDSDVYMCTLKTKLAEQREIENPNVVKVITDVHGDAIYFSRSPVPYNRNGVPAIYYKHVGIYAYRRWFLDKFSQMGRTQLEAVESLEQLRVLENGFRIRVIETDNQTIGVDAPEDLEKIQDRLGEFV